MNNLVIKKLANAGFNLPVYVEGCGSISDFYDSKATGIYVLHLAHEKCYVGQSVDVRKRFSQHKVNFDDIKGLSFRPTPENQLSGIEKQTVSLLESIGVTLTNVLLSSFTQTDSEFTDIMSLEEQERWLTDLNYADMRGERRIDNDLRSRYSTKFKKFMADPKSAEIIGFLHRYALVGIPAILKGEVSFWAVSCLPSPGHAFCRVNIYWQEVLTVFEEKDVLFFSLHLTKSLLNEYLKGVSKIECELDEHKYVPGGDDQVHLIFKTSKNALTALQNSDVQKAIRKFNLNLMRKGRCAYGRYHCFDLADKVLEA